MNETTGDNLAKRLDCLERENRSLKRAGTFVILGIAAVLIMGQAKPRDGAKMAEAERFVLRDESGKVRAKLEVVNETVVFGVHDEDGTVRASLAMVKSGAPSLSLYDKDGNTRAILGYTELETTRTLTKLEDTSTGMVMKYETTRTGKITKRAESSLVLFGKDGKVIWQAPSHPICIGCGYKLP